MAYQLSIRVTDDTWREINALAAEEQRDRSSMVRLLISRGLSLTHADRKTVPPVR